MERAGWDSLSADYRSRLERNGLSKQDYERGRSLSDARGHSKTPEHPKQYDAQKYPEYNQVRERLTKEVLEKKERMWSDKPRYRGRGSEANIRNKPPSLAQLRWAIDASEQELIDEIRESPETYSWLGYH